MSRTGLIVRAIVVAATAISFGAFSLWYMTWESYENLSTTVSPGFQGIVTMILAIDWFQNKRLSKRIGVGGAITYIACFISNLLIRLPIPFDACSLGFLSATIATGIFLAVFLWLALKPRPQRRRKPSTKTSGAIVETAVQPEEPVIVEREALAVSFDPLAKAQSWVQEEVREKMDRWTDLEIMETGKDDLQVRGKAHSSKRRATYVFAVVIKRKTGEVDDTGSYAYPVPF